jgi:uncharacterized protein (DUF433 family)
VTSCKLYLESTRGVDYAAMEWYFQGIKQLRVMAMNTNIGSLIVRTPRVLGGRPRIDGTRIAVRTIAILYKQGLSPEEIADQYTQLSLAQVYAALTYYHSTQAEIEADIAAEQEEYDRMARAHDRTQKSA